MEPTQFTGRSSNGYDFAEQHVMLTDRDWSIWRWSILRGAGFSIDAPLRLAASDCAAASAACLMREAQARQMKRVAVDLLKLRRNTDAERRTMLTNIVHTLHAGKIPKLAADTPPDVVDAIAALRLAQEQVQEALTAFRTSYDAALITTTEALYEIVATDSFQQALTWQNRQALHSAATQFLHKPTTTTNSHYRQHRLLLAKYLQRYTLKNDTIGFFGPVSWTRWQPQEIAIDWQPATNLLARRTTYLEGWCVNALGQHLSADPSCQKWAKPRLLPHVRVEGNMLHLPFVKPQPLTPIQAQVLMACDGTHTASAIAHWIAHATLTSEVEIYALLAKLQQQRRIIWSFDVPLEDPFPERALRVLLHDIGESSTRAHALAVLDRLESARDIVSQATDAVTLDRAIGALEATFTELTEQEPTRSAGQLYAGRTLIYEDCLRAGTLQLGTKLLRDLELPLTLVLTSARWLCYHIAQHWRRICHDTYTALVAKQGYTVVEFAQFFPWINSHLFETKISPFAEIQAEFHQRWAAILSLPAERSQVTFSSDAIAVQVKSSFAAPSGGWRGARFHSPDLMLAAEDMAAINQGNYHIVLGELHLALNTLDGVLFTEQHPRVADLHHALMADLPEPLVTPIAPVALQASSRIHQSFALPKDFRLATSSEACSTPLDHVLRLADLVVHEQDGTLLVRTHDGKQAFELLAVFSEYLSLAVGDVLSLLPALSHSPRLTIDRVVVAREAWSMYKQDIDFLQTTDPAEGFLAVQRWAVKHGMPRYLFYRTSKERKPCFLDFASPLYVELFMREVRGVVSDAAPDERVVSLTEMLPTPEQAWLTDGTGARYASEIRIAAVDAR